MTIHRIPTFHFYPNHRLNPGLHVQAFTITDTSHCSSLCRASTLNSLCPGPEKATGNSNRLVPWSNNPAAGAASTAVELESAADVVRKFYDGINRRDLCSVEDLISPNCIYEDLVFSQPFVGRKVKKSRSFSFNS